MISSIKPKIGSRLTRITIYVDNLNYSKTLFFNCYILPFYKDLTKNLMNIKKWYPFCGARHAKNILTLCHTLVLLFFKLWALWKVEKQTTIVNRGDFKLIDMVADKNRSGPIGRIVWITLFSIYGKKKKSSATILNALWPSNKYLSYKCVIDIA